MKLYFRKIEDKDLEMIMNWRMREDITRCMNTDPVLTLEGQRKWLKQIEQDETCKNWIIELDNVPIGTINLREIDLVNQRCSWGYYIGDKKARSLKLAMTIEWNLYDYVFEVLKLNKLLNEVLAFNKEVITIHKMCGSEVIGTLKEHICKKGVYHDLVISEINRRRWHEIKEKFQYEQATFEE